MPLVIRLRQQGRKNRVSYRLVLTDSRSPRDGKYLEKLGTYQPCENNNELTIDGARIRYWVDKGAQLSENAVKLVAKAAPEVMKEIRTKWEQKRVKTCAKNRALRKKAAAKPEKAVASK